MGYRWFDIVSNQRLLRETESRRIACTIRQRQFRLYGHVARISQVDPANRVVFARGNPRWKRPMGRPQTSWLRKSMNPAGMFLEWEEGLHVDLPGGSPGGGDTGLVRRRVPRRMLPMSE